MAHYFDADERESIRAVADVTGSTAAYVLDTKQNKTAGNLLEIRNSGVLKTSISHQGVVRSPSTIGSFPEDTSVDGQYAEMYITDNGAYVDISSQNGLNYVAMYAEDNEFGFIANSGQDYFRALPTVASNQVPYIFDTTILHTITGPLMDVKNNGNRMFRLGASGDVCLTPMTKAVRSGINATAGTIIYQSDQGSGFRFFDGGHWIKLSGVFDD